MEEDAESRAARLRHNTVTLNGSRHEREEGLADELALAPGEEKGTTSSSVTVELPTPAGVVYMCLSDVTSIARGIGSDVDVLGRRRGSGSWLAGKSPVYATGPGPIGLQRGRRLFPSVARRRHSNEPVARESPFMAVSSDARKQQCDGGEVAKAVATRNAKDHEDRVLAELRLTHMWKVMMGNAPGLPAEIAKLHATQQAKLRYQEYDERR